MMKVAICGVWHVHAGGYTSTAKNCADVIGAWDTDKEKLEIFCKEHGVYGFSSFEELLASDAEGVIVCSSTDSHVNLIIRLAKAGKHIFTEKILALTGEDCDRIEKAVAENGVNFVISEVWKYHAAPRTVKAIADSGELGKINYVRFRNCHNGSSCNWLPKHFYSRKECGGGAMIDLGAHGMYLIEWILGMPATYSSIFTVACTREDTAARNTDGVEDNAVTVMSFENGAVAINETGFVSTSCPVAFEVGGDLGYVRMENDKVRKATPKTNGAFTDVELEKELPSPLSQFLSGNILDGCGIKEAKRLTEMMENAYKFSSQIQ